MSKIEAELKLITRNVNLAHCRKRKGWSQERLARECGISPPYYNRVELLVMWPGEKIRKKICEVLGVSHDALFDRDMEMVVRLKAGKSTKLVNTMDAMDMVDRLLDWEEHPLIVESTQHEEIEARDLREKLGEALLGLDDRERIIVGHRHAGESLENIGHIVDVSKERARQIYNKAILKLQKSRGLREYGT